MPTPATPLTSQLPAPSELERLRANLAAILGEPDLRAIEPAWLAKMRDGALVTLHIGRWGGTTRAAAHDFGLVSSTPAKAARRRSWLDFGTKFLLPRRYVTRLDSLDGCARKWLARCAVPTHWGQFLTTDVYPAWKVRNEEQYRRPYLALGAEIAANYDAILAEVLAEHEQLAGDNYSANCKYDPAFRVQHPRRAAWVAAQVRQVRAAIPGAAQIQASIYFQVDLAFVPLPSLLADEWARADRITAQVRADAELQADMARLAREQREALITSFMRDTIAKIQGLLYEVSTDVLASVRQNGSVIGKSANQLRGLLAGLDQYLLFAPNEDVAQSLERIRDFLDIAPGKARQAAVPALEQQLAAVAVLARDVLVRLGDSPRTARALGIPDTPAPALVQRARRTLQLDAPSPAPTGAALQPPRARRSAALTEPAGV